MFKSLSNLSLSAVSFEFAEAEMIRVFNMNNLRTLKLWNCPSCLQIRDGLVGTSSLKTFELTMGTNGFGSGINEEEEQGEEVVQLLQTFCGLEDIFLMLPPLTDWRLIKEGILYHGSALERLVVHDRRINPDTDTDEEADGEVPWSCVSDILRHSTRLNCLGISISIRQLASTYPTHHSLPPSG